MKLGTKRLQREFIERPLSSLPLPSAQILGPTEKLSAVIAAMHSARPLGAVLIKGATGNPEGIITERDLLKLNLWEQEVLDRPAGSIRSKKLITLSPRSSLGKALHIMMTERYRQIPLLESGQTQARVLTIGTVLNELNDRLTKSLTATSDSIDFGDGPLGLLLVDSVTALMKDPALFCSSDTIVPVAIDQMRNAGKGAIAVVDRHQHPIGIFTEYDYVKRANEEPQRLLKQLVGDVMTRTPQTVLSSTSIAFVIQVCASGKFRHVPLVDGTEKITGIVSVRHIVTAIAEALVAELGMGAGSSPNKK